MTDPKDKKEKVESVNVRLPASAVATLKRLATKDDRSLRNYCKVVLIQHVEAEAKKVEAEDDSFIDKSYAGPEEESA